MTTIHLISHTHWDREWYRTFQQFRLRLVDLIDQTLDLLANDPGYRFFMLDGQTIVLDDYLHIRPEREAEIRRWVAEGRLLVGPWHILPDEFLVSPEATIRNLLQGRATAARFGPYMNVGYIPDPFGHIGQMPQILQGFGITTACVQRGLANEPLEFWWQAPDGTRVLMIYLRDGYGNAAGLPVSDPDLLANEVCRLCDSLLPHSALPPDQAHLIFMFGTDHMPPPPETARLVQAVNTRLPGDCLEHSTMPRYLEAIQPALAASGTELPVLRGELRSSQRYHLLPGVLSARLWIKQRNQACQTLLERWVEPFCAWAEMVSPPGDLAQKNRGFLRAAWRLLMENHPHDSICGCSIDQVHAEMRPRFDQVEQLGEELTRRSLEEITRQVDTRGPAGTGPALVVFNAAQEAQTGVVAFEAELPAGCAGLEVVDDHGAVLPLQSGTALSHDLFYVEMDGKTLLESFGMIEGGIVNGRVVRSFQNEIQGSQMSIELILADEGQPDLAAWNQARQDVKALVEAGRVKSFRVRAHSAPARSSVLLAPEVPGFGYRTFWVRPLPCPEAEGQPTRLSPLVRLAMPAGAWLAKLPAILQSRLRLPKPDRFTPKPPYRIENEFFTIEASLQDGILNLLDKRNGVQFAGLNRFVDGGDCGDEYNYSPPDTDCLISEAQVDRVLVERSPVSQTIEIHLQLNVPPALAPDRKSRLGRRVRLPITTRVTLYPGVPRAEVRTTVDNRSLEGQASALVSDHRLRVHFPAPFTSQSALYDGHFERLERPIALPDYDSTWAEAPRPEKPQRDFTAISGSKGGLAIANRGLPEVEALTTPYGSEIALTLLRGVGWLSRDDFSTRKGHAGPMLATPEAQMPGRYTYEYAILPYPPEAQEEAFALAVAFQTPLRAVVTQPQVGTLPSSQSLLTGLPAAFQVSAIKPVQEGEGWIVRGVSHASQPLRLCLRSWRKFEHAEVVNLAEEVQGEIPLSADGSLEVEARPHQIISLRFR